MAKPRKSKRTAPQKPSADLLRIGGWDTQIVQMMDFLDTNDPELQRIMVVSFKKARLSDANDTEIFEGQVIVRVLTAPSPGTLAILSRLLQPFDGYFVMNVVGIHVALESHAEVVADFIRATNIQPHTKRKHRHAKGHMLTLE